MDRERQRPDGRRRHLPHLLHDQAHRLGRARCSSTSGACSSCSTRCTATSPSGERCRSARCSDDGSVTLVKPRAPHEHARRADAHDRPARRRSSRTTRSTPRSPRPARALGRGQTLESVTALLAEHPLKFHPGTHWNYGLSTDIVGPAGRDPLGAALRRVPAARDLRAARAWSTPASSSPRTSAPAWPPATSTARPTRPRLMEGPFANGILRPRSYLSGAGGLVSTTHDYVAFCQMLANGGQLDGRRVLGRKTLELMTVNHLPGGATLQDLAVGGFGEAGFEGVGFGLGFAVGLGPAATAMAGSGGRVLLGRRGQHGVLGRPGRGPLRRLHDPALPLRRLPVPGPAARARLPGHRRLMAEVEEPVGPADATRGPALRRARHLRPAAHGRRRWRAGTSPSSACPSTAGRATGPAPASGRPPCARARACSGPTTRRSRTRCPSSWPRWSTPATSPARPSAPRRRWRRSRPGPTRCSSGGGRLVAIGGDHTIALPLLRATARRHGPLALVHFDAHLDTWDTYFGQRFTHGTPFRRAWEEGLLLRDRSVHVGLARTRCTRDVDLTDDAGMGFAQMTTDDVAAQGVAAVVRADAGAGGRRARLRVGRHRRPRPGPRAGHRDARGGRPDQPRAAGPGAGPRPGSRRGRRRGGGLARPTTTPRSRPSPPRTCSTSW